MEHVNIGTAFLSGILSFLSPCVLPLIPGYLSYISGLSLEELSRGTNQSRIVIFRSILFVLGFSLVFTLLGASASALGNFLTRYNFIFSKIAGLIIMLFGLHLLGILRLSWLYYEKRIHWGHIRSEHLGPFIMGLAFAFGWTPCIGPILAGILALAATQNSIIKGTFLLFIYSLGLGIPLILTAWSVNRFLKLFNLYKKFIPVAERLAGILLLLMGLLIFTNKLTALLRIIPSWLYKFSV